MQVPLDHMSADDVAGTFTGEHWLDHIMQLPSAKSKVFIFTQSGMVYAVPADQLPTCEGASFQDLAINKVNHPCQSNHQFILFHVCLP